MTPRLGFVGVGWIGRLRMEALVKAGAAEVGALCDASPEALAQASKLAPDAAAVSTYEELLALDLDGVVIATPNALHAEQAKAALGRGLAVFCQKPLGRDAGETRAIVEAAEKAGRPLGLDLSYRHKDAMQQIRAIVRRGGIGRVFAADLAFHNAYGPDKGWFYDRALSGGGCMLDLGIHLVDLALWTLDHPRVEHVTSRLFAAGRPLAPGARDVEDYATARLDLDTGAAVDIACSWRVSAGCDCVIGATFHGTNGSLRVENIDGSFYHFRADRLHGTKRETLAEPAEDRGGGAIVAWAEALAKGERFDPAGWRHVDVMRALDGVYGR